MLHNVQIRVYAYKIAPIIDGKVTSAQFQAIDIANNTANLLADMYNGKADCSSCGIVQYNDIVNFSQITEDNLQMILSTYPFVSRIIKW